VKGPMKVALVRKDFDPNAGGAERYVANLAGALLAGGHEVHLYAARVKPPLPEGLVHHPVPLLKIWSPVKLWSFILGARRALKRNAPRGGYDVVHGLTQFFPGDVYRLGDGFHLPWLQVSSTRLGLSLKSLTARNRAILGIERRIMRLGSYRRVIAPSLLVRRQAVRLFGARPDRTEVVYNGVDARAFAGAGEGAAVRERLGIGADDVALLFVGQNYRRKGLDTVLEAMARTGDGRFHLIVVGREKGSAYRRTAARLGIGAHVHFAGTTDRIADYYAAADALVFPSLYDPFANVVLEAMAAGLVVVASRTTGASELIRHGQNGFVIADGRAVDALAEVLPHLADAELRRRLGARAAQVAAVMTPELNARATIEVYRSVVAEKRAERKRRRKVATALIEGVLINARYEEALVAADVTT